MTKIQTPAKTRNILNTLIFYALLLTLILAPLPFGSNRIWSQSLLSVITSMLLIIWSINLLVGRGKMHVSPQRIWYIIIPYSIVIIWSLVQIIIPVPESWLNPVWNMTASVLEDGANPRISVNTTNSIVGLMKLLCYGTVFWLALQFGRSSERARKIIKLFVFASLTYALYGLAVDISGAQKVLWFDKWAYENSVTSTFVNRNSYATYAGIGALASIALLFDSIFSQAGKMSGRQLKEALLTNFASHSYRYLLITIIILAALILTHSRAGLASFAIGAVALFISIGVTKPMRQHKKWLIIIVILFLPLIIILLSSGGKDTFYRFSKLDEQTKTRIAIYQTSADIVQSNPFLGTGLGNFENVFRLYRNPSIPFTTIGRVDRAHNTYLELAVDLGIPATALMIMSVIFIFLICWKGAKRRKRNAIYPALGIGISVLVGVHALFDFSIEIPAIAFTYAVLMGVCCAQSWSSQKDEVRPSGSHKTMAVAGIITGCCLLALSLPNFISSYISLSGDKDLQAIQNNEEVTIEQVENIIDSRKQAKYWIPGGQLDSELGQAEFKLAEIYGIDTEEGTLYLSAAYEDTYNGLQKNPLSPLDWLRLGIMHALMEGPSTAMADAMKLSIATGPNEPQLLYYRLSLALPELGQFDEEGQEMLASQICTGWSEDSEKMQTFFADTEEQYPICAMLPQCTGLETTGVANFCQELWNEMEAAEENFEGVS